MKKRLLLFLWLLCITAKLSVVFAGSVTVAVDKKSAGRGETVGIDVTLGDNSGILAAIFTLTYDKDRLALIGAEDGGLLEGATFSERIDAYPYKMVWNSASASDFTENGTLASLTFRVREDAKPGKAYIALAYDEDDCFDVDLNNVTITLQNGGIDVTEPEKPSGGGKKNGGHISVKTETVDTLPVRDDTSRQIVFTINEHEAVVFGEVRTNDVAPIIKNDRTMLPARFVAENLGAAVEWSEDERKVTVTKGGTVIVLYIDSDTAFINGEKRTLDSPAFIENDRTYTPLRFLAENLGAKVEWKEDTKQVILTAGE